MYPRVCLFAHAFFSAIIYKVQNTGGFYNVQEVLWSVATYW